MSAYGSAYEVVSCVRGDDCDVVSIKMPKHDRIFRVVCMPNDSDRVVAVQEMTSGKAKTISSRPTREHIMEIGQAYLKKNPRPPDED